MHREAIPCEVEGQPCYQVPVGKSAWAIVDAEDLELVSKYTWSLTREGYVFATVKEGGKSRKLTMHRLVLITNAPQIDHENLNKLDNRRKNLRPATAAQNQQNRRGASSRSSTGIRNVYLQGNSYLVRLGVNGKVMHVGSYPDIESASAAAEWARSVYFTHAKESGKPVPLPRCGAYAPEDWKPSPRE